MTHTTTFQESYDKIIQAYFRDEIQPYEAKFCFCGTLCNNKSNWQACSIKVIYNNGIHKDYMDYTGKQYADMERALLVGLKRQESHEYEDSLFARMSAALDVLREIHESRGEVIDPTPSFTKRQLANKELS